MQTIFILLTVLLASGTLRVGSLHGITPDGLYVSPTGSDSNPGTAALPFATLEAARDAIRSGSTQRVVWLRGGTYYRTNTFALTSLDNGVTYRAYPQETVLLSGGTRITNFVAVTDEAALARLTASAQANALVADLSGYAITDYGDLTNRGAARESNPAYSGFTRPWMAQVIYSNSWQQIARWPNQDVSGEKWAWSTNPVPPAPKQALTANWFTYREADPGTWTHGEDIWLHGLWTYRWADSYEKVVTIGSSTNAFITDRPGDYGYSVNDPYEALNALETLDVAGEWSLDRTNQLLYFWPPGVNANTLTVLTSLAGDLVSISGASNVVFRGLTFQDARGSGIYALDATNTLVAGCLFRNLGNLGIVVGNAIYTNVADTISVSHNYRGGSGNRIIGCEFTGTGEGGVALAGGSRVTLSSCANTVSNCWFHGYNRNVRCYRPAVKLDGVGCVVSHCTVQDSPHQAFWFSGNDHLIEYCNIFDVCKDTGDAGAIYCVARDWKQRGTVLRYNFIQPLAQYAFYLDDFTCGVTAYGNIISCSSLGWLVGGGRDNVFFNNLVVGYNSTGWQVSNRGTTWAASAITNMVTLLKQVDYTNAPYSSYPGMSTLTADVATYDASPIATNLYWLSYAKGNSILTNSFIYANAYNTDIDTNYVSQAANYYTTLLTDFSPGFVSTNAYRAHLWTMTNGAPPLALGFEQVSTNGIGCLPDIYSLIGSQVPVTQSASARSPFLGSALSVPGTIQVEDFDAGPLSDAFYQANPNRFWNNAWGDGRYRLNAEFYIWGELSQAAGGRIYKMTLSNGCWAEYTLSIAETRDYSLTVVFDPVYGGAGSLSFTLDGSTIATGVSTNSPTASVALTSGTHTLRMIESGDNRLDYLTFE